ncbi:hypothetical protein GCM10010274_64390 [Streptomyces lavendofoliae]|uniref:Secreted protein n=1 Tax=Streptomyces lavendofoliae TaxID=67314 RepID=A0A918I5H2_9ACTN|nr:hypothetical protein GCM10010274_64390 [Streptomyces lavendofoliae]
MSLQRCDRYGSHENTKRAITAVILMSAALSAPTQAHAVDMLAAPGPAGGLPLLGGLLGAVGPLPAVDVVGQLLPNGILGG